MTGRTIRLLRESKNIKRCWLAEQLDIDESTLSKIENDQVNISVRRLTQIAGILEINILEFFSEKPEEQIASQVRALSLKDITEKIGLLTEQNSLLIKVIEQNNLINTRLLQALETR